MKSVITCICKCCFNCSNLEDCRQKGLACGESTNKDCVGIVDNDCPNFIEIKKEE